MRIHYLEIVMRDADATCALYERVYGLRFGAADAGLGGARTAARADGGVVGVRAPLAAHEAPVMRAYVAVDDIARAVEAAAARGAHIAYPPTEQGGRGIFAIFIEGGVQHGLWQRAK